MEKKLDLSIIIPVHNEAHSIERVINEIYSKIIDNFSGNSEMVVAEDGSSDGTKEVLQRLQSEKGFRLVTGIERKGYNRALKDALSLAEGEFVFISDSGGGHEMSDFFKLFNEIKNGDYGAVSGHKKSRKDVWYRLVLSHGYNLYVSLLFGHRFHDIDSGFKLYKKEALNLVLPDVSILNECISTEILLRMYKNGYGIKEIPIIHYKRGMIGGPKTFSIKKIPRITANLFFDLLKLKKKI